MQLKTLKTIGAMIVSLSVGTVVNNVAKATTPVRTKLLDRIMIFIGVASISTMIGDKAVKHFETSFDKTVESAKKMVTEDQAEKK